MMWGRANLTFTAMVAVSLGLTVATAGAAKQDSPEQGAPSSPISASAPGTTIEIYRPGRFMCKDEYIPVIIDDKEVGRIQSGRFLTVRVAPGTHTVRGDETPPAQVEVRTDQAAFVRLRYDHIGGWCQHDGVGVAVIAPDEAQRELAGLKPSDAKYIYASEVAPAPLAAAPAPVYSASRAPQHSTPADQRTASRESSIYDTAAPNSSPPQALAVTSNVISPAMLHGSVLPPQAHAAPANAGAFDSAELKTVKDAFDQIEQSARSAYGCTAAPASIEVTPWREGVILAGAFLEHHHGWRKDEHISLNAHDVISTSALREETWSTEGQIQSIAGDLHVKELCAAPLYAVWIDVPKARYALFWQNEADRDNFVSSLRWLSENSAFLREWWANLPQVVEQLSLPAAMSQLKAELQTMIFRPTHSSGVGAPEACDENAWDNNPPSNINIDKEAVQFIDSGHQWDMSCIFCLAGQQGDEYSTPVRIEFLKSSYIAPMECGTQFGVGDGITLLHNSITGWKTRADAQQFADAFNRLVADANGDALSLSNEQSEQFKSIAAAWRTKNPKPPIPDEAHEHWVLAINAVEEKNANEAIEEFSAALKVFPTWPEAQFNLAIFCGETGDYNCAVEHMQDYLELVPNAPDSGAAKDKLIVWRHKLESRSN